jgi:hypothetical protein
MGQVSIFNIRTGYGLLNIGKKQEKKENIEIF